MEQEEGIKRVRAMEEAQFSELGYYVHVVFDEAGNLDIHTHRVQESFGIPDIQVFLPLPRNQIMPVVESAVDFCKANKVEVGVDYAGIIKGFKLRFINAKESGRDVLRVILPDAKGNLDRDKLSGIYLRQYEDPAKPGYLRHDENGNEIIDQQNI